MLHESAVQKPAVASPPSADLGSAGAALTGRRRAADVPEETLWEGSFSPKAMLGPLVGCAVGSVVLIGAAIFLSHDQHGLWMIPLGLLAVMWIAVLGRMSSNRLGIHYKLTNQMFYHQRGILTRVTDRIEAIDIDDVTYEQSLFNRLVNVGRIRIDSSDRTDPVFWLEGIENVEEVAKMIDRARRAERIRRGVSVESLTPQAPPPS